MADIQTWRTPEAVRAWLEQQRKGLVVGLAGRASECTLAHCYRELSGVSVAVDKTTISIGHELCTSHHWETRFVAKHDDIWGRNGYVTRERALEILNQIAPVPA